MPIKYPVYHKGEDGCGEVAMHTVRENAQVGDPLIASEFFSIEGDAFEPGDLAICGNCCCILEHINAEWIDYDNPVPSTSV